MVKSELVEKILDENPHLKKDEAAKMVDIIFSEIKEALSRNERVEIRGFGVFGVKHYEARTGRNPRTGESVEVEAKAAPYFKTGKLLRQRLNGKV